MYKKATSYAKKKQVDEESPIQHCQCVWVWVAVFGYGRIAGRFQQCSTSPGRSSSCPPSSQAGEVSLLLLFFQQSSPGLVTMASPARAHRSGLLELRSPGERWLRILLLLGEETLSFTPEPEPGAPEERAVNGGESTGGVPESIINLRRTVRVVKQDAGGLGVSIKGKCGLSLCSYQLSIKI